jgi:hypothetical protein
VGEGKGEGMDSNQLPDVYAEALPDLRQIVQERETVRHSLPEILPSKPTRLETATFT